MPIDYSVPSWLVPPSQAQQQQLDLQKQQIAMQQQAQQQKSALMLRKQIGLSRMQDEAKTLESQRVDPITARKTALLNNASLIFGDNPEALQRLMSSDEAQAVRQDALNQRMEQFRQTDQRLRAAATESNDLKRELADSNLLSKQADLLLRGKDQEISLLRTRNAFVQGQVEEQGRNQRAQAALNQKIMDSVAKDPEIKQLTQDLSDAQVDVRRWSTAQPTWMGLGTSQKEIQTKLDDAKQRMADTTQKIAARRAELKKSIDAPASNSNDDSTGPDTSPDNADPLGIRSILK